MSYSTGELTTAKIIWNDLLSIWNVIKWLGRTIHKIVTITRWIAWYAFTALLIIFIIVMIFT